MDWGTISLIKRRLKNEKGTTYKDWGGRLPIAIAYANTYSIGMSNLGVHVIYRLFNEQPNIVCERVFHEQDGVSISLESQRPLTDFAVLAFSLSFELDYFNVVAMLQQAGIPLRAEHRDETHPLLIAGGPCVTANPEPLAPMFDAFVIGEGEVVAPAMADTLWHGLELGREDLLKRLASIPGVYVPRFYHIDTENEHIVSIRPVPGLRHPVQRQWLADLDTFPASSVIVTEETEFGDMYLMEVSRGCRRGCRFCLAGFAYLPMRERSLEVLLAIAEEGLKHRRKLGLIGASLSDYSHIEQLVTGLRGLGAEISVASLRVDPLPKSLLRALAASGAQTLTIAPEAASERLRNKINKGISTESIMQAVELAADYEFPHLKLYFMIGLPTETDSDARQIVELVRSVRERFHRHLTVNISAYVPKAQTPFQRMPMAPRDVLEERLRYVKRSLRPINVATRADSIRWAEVQGVLARGDRRVGQALMSVEGSTLSAWRRAMERAELKPELYLRARSKDEVLPWSTVSAGASAGRPLQEVARLVPR
ncbi:MAG: radical SAM protein [Anaerolineae bacterium]|nr:radical SAM protein [Anaerolineae bacterium]NIN95299.1 radical SAM protein [Anaerolineae bacterium]NIQ78264.1 radical SAM protein [Anaerolineae bacterium]